MQAELPLVESPVITGCKVIMRKRKAEKVGDYPSLFRPKKPLLVCLMVQRTFTADVGSGLTCGGSDSRQSRLSSLGRYLLATGAAWAA